ncbi:heparanase [Vombatus ursinus]|uniref:Heparanase n=1 Tax=Vombatus ursinus TaxID=29139 RepID=A0A4X2KLQ3_VOMUR|nr:heparanase [Vombatus ursinus]
MQPSGWVSVMLLLGLALHLIGLPTPLSGSPLAVTEGKAPGKVLTLDLNRSKVREVSLAFLSVTIDSNLITHPRYITFLSSQRLRTLARGLSPAYLRFGGTKADFLIFDPEKESTFEKGNYWEAQINPDICNFSPLPSAMKDQLELEWPFQELLLLKERRQNLFEKATFTKSELDLLYSFAKCSGLHLIFGVNALIRKSNLQWDSSNAKLLLKYCTSQKYDISWELGNEPNSFRKKSGMYINGSQLGKDFIKFHSLLKRYDLRNAKLFGPDIGQLRNKSDKLLRSFLEVGGGVIDAVTWHHYYMDGRNATQEDFLNPKVLDTFIFSAQQILQVVKETRPGKKIWLGETSSAYGGGAPKLSDTYTAGFLWLDKLGLSAKMGIEGVMRQVLFGAGNYHLVDGNFDPMPDYWLSLLFKQLVGTKVLTASVKSPDEGKLRLYLHCTNSNHPKYKEGDLTLYVLNLHNNTKYLKLPSKFCGKHVEKYILEPSEYQNLLSQSVKLNGHVLKMVDNQTLPALIGKPLCLGCPLTLPPFSYGFFVILNAKVVACI